MNTKSLSINKILEDDFFEILNYFKTQFPIFHNSNVFYRDVQNGVKNYLWRKNIIVNNKQLEDLTGSYCKIAEDKNIFKKISDNNWTLNYPEFKTVTPGDPL